MAKIKKSELYKDVIEKVKKEQNIFVKCPRCETDIWKYSYNYLIEIKKVYCGKCDDFFDININLKIKWTDLPDDNDEYIDDLDWIIDIEKLRDKVYEDIKDDFVSFKTNIKNW